MLDLLYAARAGRGGDAHRRRGGARARGVGGRPGARHRAAGGELCAPARRAGGGCARVPDGVGRRERRRGVGPVLLPS